MSHQHEDDAEDDDESGAATDNEADDDDPVLPPPYVYDRAHAAIVAPVFTASVATLTDPFDLSGVPESPAGKASFTDEGLRRESVAFGLYRLDVHRGDGSSGATLEPLEDPAAGWHLVRPIRETSSDVHQFWEDLSTLFTDPVLASRSHDLCFSARHGNVGAHGSAAVDAYLLWPSTTLDPLHVSEGLARAWTLARAMSNEALEHAAYQAAHDYARSKLDTDGNPGTVFPLLELISVKAKKGTSPIDKATVTALLTDAHAKNPSAYLQVRVAQLMRRIATDDAEREAADRAEVQAHLDEAERSSGGAKMIHLRNAAQTARNLGAKDLDAQAVAAMQAFPVDELDLKLQRVSTEMPAYIVGSVLRPFDEADDWRGALQPSREGQRTRPVSRAGRPPAPTGGRRVRPRLGTLPRSAPTVTRPQPSQPRCPRVRRRHLAQTRRSRAPCCRPHGRRISSGQLVNRPADHSAKPRRSARHG